MRQKDLKSYPQLIYHQLLRMASAGGASVDLSGVTALLTAIRDGMGTVDLSVVTGKVDEVKTSVDEVKAAIEAQDLMGLSQYDEHIVDTREDGTKVFVGYARNFLETTGLLALVTEIRDRMGTVDLSVVTELLTAIRDGMGTVDLSVVTGKVDEVKTSVNEVKAAIEAQDVSGLNQYDEHIVHIREDGTKVFVGYVRNFLETTGLLALVTEIRDRIPTIQTLLEEIRDGQTSGGTTTVVDNSDVVSAINQMSDRLNVPLSALSTSRTVTIINLNQNSPSMNIAAGGIYGITVLGKQNVTVTLQSDDPTPFVVQLPQGISEVWPYPVFSASSDNFSITCSSAETEWQVSGIVTHRVDL